MIGLDRVEIRLMMAGVMGALWMTSGCGVKNDPTPYVQSYPSPPKTAEMEKNPKASSTPTPPSPEKKDE